MLSQLSISLEQLSPIFECQITKLKIYSPGRCDRGFNLKDEALW
jgi:hypothetical protein